MRLYRPAVERGRPPQSRTPAVASTPPGAVAGLGSDSGRIGTGGDRGGHDCDPAMSSGSESEVRQRGRPPGRLGETCSWEASVGGRRPSRSTNDDRSCARATCCWRQMTHSIQPDARQMFADSPWKDQIAQRMQVDAAGRATSRSAAIDSPQLSHVPYRPCRHLWSAPSISLSRDSD